MYSNELYDEPVVDNFQRITNVSDKVRYVYRIIYVVINRLVIVGWPAIVMINDRRVVIICLPRI